MPAKRSPPPPSTRTEAQRDAQAAYEAQMRAAGKHVHLAANLKRAEDVRMFQRLQKRLPHETKSSIVILALRELAARKN